MKIKNLPLILIVSVFASNLLAQDTTLQDLNRNLDQKKSEIEDSLRPMMDEKTQIEDQQKLLEKRLAEIDTEKAKALGKIEQLLPPEQLRNLMLKNQTWGSCKIKNIANSSEFIIEQGQKKIRFLIAPTEAGKSPVARLLGDSNHQFIEIVQNDYIPENPVSPTGFKVVLRFEAGTEKVVHAVFTGERLDDGLFGWTSSRQPTILSCIL